MQKSNERLWHLDIAAHTNSKAGIPYRGLEHAELVWKEYGALAKEMSPGFHNLTPPNLIESFMNGLYVHENYHGTHRVDNLEYASRYLSISPLDYANAPKGMHLTRLPEDATALNFVFDSGGLPRIYYMLRWLHSPELSYESPKRELAGVAAGLRRPQLSPITIVGNNS